MKYFHKMQSLQPTRMLISFLHNFLQHCSRSPPLYNLVDAPVPYSNTSNIFINYILQILPTSLLTKHLTSSAVKSLVTVLCHISHIHNLPHSKHYTKYSPTTPSVDTTSCTQHSTVFIRHMPELDGMLP